MSEGRRIKREKHTVTAMIRLYCKKQHGTKDRLCADCQELFDYAMIRLSKCRFTELKPTCGKCPVHCYQPAMRERIVRVMKNAGPRMLRSHPVMAVRHLLDGFKKVSR